MPLLKQIQSSVYLSEILARLSDLNDYASGRKSVDEAMLQAQIDALVSCDRFLLEKTDKCSEHLRETKQRFSLLWSLADLAGTIEFADLGRLQSQFADAVSSLHLN